MTIPKPETIELHPAFLWDCPECGREQIERLIVLLDAAGRMSTPFPGEVKCPDCGSTFDTDVEWLKPRNIQ